MEKRPIGNEEPRAFGTDGVPMSPAFEPHLTIQQIAEMWNLSPDAVRRIFRKEPGVVEIKKEKGAFKRRSYISLRIPQSVARRVHQKLSVVR